MNYFKEGVSIRLETVINNIIKNHCELKLSSLDLVKLCYAMEAIRALPEFIPELPAITIRISDVEIEITSTGFSFTDYDNYLICFDFNCLDVNDFDWYEKNVENILDQY